MESVKVFYLCDGTACATCDGTCRHTSNIAHAKNFKAHIDSAPQGVEKTGFMEIDRAPAPARYGGKAAKILDVACGGKMFYFDKTDPRVLFCDNRQINTTLCDGREFVVAPDIVADFTALPFPDAAFNVVVFDPPHLLHTNPAPVKGYQQIKYGHLGSDWQDVIKNGFAECFRVLADNGVLIFKWNETDITVCEILKLTPRKPVFGHKSGKASKTHWLCFIK